MTGQSRIQISDVEGCHGNEADAYRSSIQAYPCPMCATLRLFPTSLSVTGC
jgi:hypothetical protein